MCETLCKGCHAAEHGIIPPKKGWEYCGNDDLEDLIGTCEACGSSIRHVYYIDHPNWPTLEVGTVCCDNLTGTNTASSLRRLQDRKNKFINSKRWKQVDQNYQIKQKKVDVLIYKEAGGYKLSMNQVNGKMRFQSLVDAKEKVFDFIDSGEAEEFFKCRKSRKEV